MKHAEKIPEEKKGGERPSSDMLKMTSEVVSAYVSHNVLPANQLSDVINTIHNTLAQLARNGNENGHEAGKPAVSARKSITPDYIICLEDGKKLKMLKRHLRTTYNLSPEEYRAKWGLPADYPMVAPNYAKRRSEFAKKIGLGRKGSSRRNTAK